MLPAKAHALQPRFGGRPGFMLPAKTCAFQPGVWASARGLCFRRVFRPGHALPAKICAFRPRPRRAAGTCASYLDLYFAARCLEVSQVLCFQHNSIFLVGTLEVFWRLAGIGASGWNFCFPARRLEGTGLCIDGCLFSVLFWMDCAAIVGSRPRSIHRRALEGRGEMVIGAFLGRPRIGTCHETLSPRQFFAFSCRPVQDVVFTTG